MIDGILFLVLAGILAGPIAGLFPDAFQRMLAERTSRGPTPEAASGILEATVRWALAVAFLSPLYGLIEAVLAWSPGKLILGFRIGEAAGRPAAARRLFIRYLVKASSSWLGFAFLFTGLQLFEYASWLAGGVVLIGCFFVLGPARQAIHDRVARTAVFRRADLLIAAPDAPA